MIQPPNWKKDAIPARNGWKDPKTGEILKSQSITQAQIDEYMGVKPEPKKDPMLHTHDNGITHSHAGGNKPHTHDDIVESKSLHEMTKLELEALGRQHGVELDRRYNKTRLIEELTDHMEMKDYDDCSKMELEAIGRRYGIELDRRKKKETLIEELEEVLDDEVQIT